MTARILIALLAGLAMAGLSTSAHAGSDFDAAIKAGAERLSAEEIAKRLTGKTVTFVFAANDARFLVYYGENNEVAGKPVGGETIMTGFQAVTDRDQICLGWEGRELPRLRCMDVVLIDGVMHKFDAAGSLMGRVIDIAEGNMT
jgi:hypothetical protein